jgi:proline iminopeptidase
MTNARLYYREIGQGQPLVILHGGPDFDHHYLLPAMDRLADSFRLIYYDQRGRGRSGGQVEPDEVSMASEVADCLRIMEHFQLDRAALLGHSWGALLALEFALRHPDRVSHLILMNPAPASHADLGLFRMERQRTAAADLAAMRALSATAAYEAGDLAVECGHCAFLERPEEVHDLIVDLCHRRA